MGEETRDEIPVADLRISTGHDVEQPAGGAAGRRRSAVADAFVHAVGFFGEPLVRPSGDFVGDVDVAALAGIPGDSARYESGSGPAFPGGDQSTDRARLAVFAAECG